MVSRILISFVLLFATASLGLSQAIVLTGGRLYKSSHSFVERSVVVMNEGKIFIIGRADKRLSNVNLGGQYSDETPHVIDVEGKFLAPGMHSVYFGVDRDSGEFDQTVGVLQAILRWGTTWLVASIHDPSLLRAVREELRQSPESYPETRFVGELGSLSSDQPRKLTRNSPNRLRRLEEFSRAGAAAVHLRLEGSGSGRWSSELDELVARARELGVAVWVQTDQLAIARRALKAGATGLTAGIADETVDEEFLSLLRATESFYLSPLAEVENAADRAGMVARLGDWMNRSNPPPFGGSPGERDAASKRRAVLRHNLGRVVRGGVPVALGADLTQPWLIPGLAVHIEQSLASEAGLTSTNVYDLAHRDATRLVDNGQAATRLLPSTPVNLVVLDKDPLLNADHLQSIRWVIRLGAIHDPPRRPLAQQH